MDTIGLPENSSLMFLLSPASQAALIRKVAAVLSPGGSFLFTAPSAAIEWSDSLTGCTSASLGAESYRRLLEDAGLLLVGEQSDEGDNHYYIARKA